MKRLITFSIVLLMTVCFLSAQIEYDVKKPDATSQWVRGSTKFIKWDKKGDTYPNVKIRLYSFPGNVKVLGITDSTANSESFDWKIPIGIALGKYFVRVKTLNNANFGDSGVFEISKMTAVPGNPTLEVKKKFTAVPGLHMLAKKPEITQVSSTPTGTLKPGSRVYVKGVNFGTAKGKIIMKGNLPDGQIYLENVTWINHLTAQGFIPKSLNGEPAQKVEIVIETAGGTQSDPYKWELDFTGREIKLLTSDVVGVMCGNDANCNTCNQTGTCDSEFVAGCLTKYAICGEHVNNWGTVGDDVGDDIYSINLKNGWVLKSINIMKWHKSSGGEVLSGPTPAFPAGSSNWSPVIHWLVTPNDNVRYEIEIMVEGPIGTNYK